MRLMPCCRSPIFGPALLLTVLGVIATTSSANAQSEPNVNRDPRALRQQLDSMGNPSIMVVMLEANMNREVLRPIADARLKQALIKQGFRVQAAPVSYLKHLADVRKAFEFRTHSRGEMSVNPVLGSATSIHIDEEYLVNWRQLVLGQGNDEDTFKAAKEIGARYVLIGDCYTQEQPMPPAAKAWADQGYHQARAYLNLQVMSTANHDLAAAKTAEASGMDFTAEGAGNKAIAAAANRAAEDLGFEIATNIRELGLK